MKGVVSWTFKRRFVAFIERILSQHNFIRTFIVFWGSWKLLIFLRWWRNSVSMKLDMLIKFSHVKWFLTNYTFNKLNRLIHYLMLRLLEGIALRSVFTADHLDVLTINLWHFAVILNRNLIFWSIIYIFYHLNTIVR